MCRKGKMEENMERREAMLMRRGRVGRMSVIEKRLCGRDGWREDRDMED